MIQIWVEIFFYKKSEAKRLAKLALEKGKHHSNIIAKKIVDKAKIEAKKLLQK